MKWVELVITEVNLEEIWQQPELQSSLWCDPWSKDSNEKGWGFSQFYLHIRMQTSWTKLFGRCEPREEEAQKGTREWYLIYILWGSGTYVIVYCVCSVGRNNSVLSSDPLIRSLFSHFRIPKVTATPKFPGVIADRNAFWSLDRKISGLITAAFLAGDVSNKAGIQ